MKKTLSKALFIISVSALLSSCADHDDPKLAPIDTSQIKISANVSDVPTSSWLAETEEMTINVSNVEMTAPKGVVLKSISLIANNGKTRYLVDDKPYSGEQLEFKIPLNGLQGRINLSIRGNLIKKDSRDAEIMIKDNIQRIVFTSIPQFECEGWLYVSVCSKSTSGEEYNHSFEVKSTDHFTIPISKSELYWTPTSGTASNIEVTLEAGANSWSPNTTFNNKITNIAIGHSSDNPQTLKMTIPNVPGSLNSERLQLYVKTSYYGTWEDITIDPYNLSNVFDIIEKE